MVVRSDRSQIEIVPEQQTLSFAVMAGYGDRRNGYQDFSLSIDANQEQLSLIEKVVYHIHPTFPQEYWTSENAQGDFASAVYSTYSSNWQTLGTRIYLRDGSVLDLSGTLIRWP